MTIFYKLHNKLYVNITNRCCCACEFCIRDNSDSVGGADTLWLDREPTVEEICNAFDDMDLSDVDEVVYCGYGEPMERADDLVESAVYIRDHCQLPIRINTNGLVKLIDPMFSISKLCGVIDSISISLNSDNADDYLKITNSCFGIESYEKMLEFSFDVKKYVKNVIFTVVDVISDEQMQNCEKIAKKMGITLRVRHNVTDNENYV